MDAESALRPELPLASSSSSSSPALAVPRAPLSRGTRTALGVAGAACALGVLGDALLRPAPWGLNLTLWTLALVAACAALQRWARTDEPVVGWMPVALAAALLMAWRDSPTLKAMDLAALLVVLGLAVFRARGGAVRAAGMMSYAAGLLGAVADAAFGAAPLLRRDVRWAELPREGWTRHAAAAARGVLIAVPLLALFGSLLVSADAGFERLLSTTFNLDFPLTVSHLLLALTFAWLAGGILRALVLPGAPGPAPAALPAAASTAKPAHPTLGIVEIATVLGMLDVLFAAFVAVQLPYLFGGAAHVRAPGTVTYSEYAHRGFFELVAVAGLVLPLLLGTHWLLRRGNARHETVFRVAAGAMVALVFVIIASGLHRMRLYQLAYGLTELRVYTTAFMLWLAVVFAWLCNTVLRGRRERFAFGALTAAFETLVVLHAVSPDALIVRANAGRNDAEVRFDAAYAASLSADAVPALLAALPALPADDRCAAATRLRARWSGHGEDWRAWSLDRGRAVSQVRRHAAELASACPAAAKVAAEPAR